MADRKVALREIFNSVDANGDNEICVSELRTAMAGCDQFTEADLQEFHKFCDTDGDKKVSYDEFEAFFTALSSQ